MEPAAGDVQTASPGRTRAFRIVAGLLGAMGVLLSVPFAIISFFDDEQAIHQLHNLAFAGLYGVLLGASLLACARRPDDHRSSFLVAVASGIAGAIAGLLSGDFVTGFWYIGPISIALLWALHPSRDELLRPAGVDPATAAVSVVALIPAVAFALTQAELQRNGVEGDQHWEFHHYSGMAATALGLALCGLAASVRESGRRLGAWLVGASALLVGGASLLLSDHAGALEPLWAWLTLVWGVAIVTLAERARGTERP
jgi:hypothetical protein